MNSVLTCQLNTPGIIVKFANEINKPICSSHDNVKKPPITLKSEIPLNRFITAPNQINVKALLQQQKINKIKDSSK